MTLIWDLEVWSHHTYIINTISSPLQTISRKASTWIGLMILSHSLHISVGWWHKRMWINSTCDIIPSVLPDNCNGFRMEKEILDMLAKTPMIYFNFKGEIVLPSPAASQFTELFIQIFKQANFQEQTFSHRPMQLSFTGIQVGCKSQEKQTGHCMGYQDCHSNNGSRETSSQFQFHNWIVEDWRRGVWKIWVEGLVWK